MEQVYLDYNASTPVAPQVRDAMVPLLDAHYGNPSCGHWAGKPARLAVQGAREQVAGLLGCSAEEVIFTSGGSEANNHAIIGSWSVLRDRGNADILPLTVETLTPADRYNEYVMTSLRTSQGCSLSELTRMGSEFRDIFLQGIAAPMRAGWLEDHAGHLRLTRAGKLMADRIASDLFIVNEELA